MYNKYFGFTESPFSVTPDPRFFYTNSLYREALAILHYGIKAKKGFIVITGEVGTGKTTLLRKLMRNLEPTMRSVFVFNTYLTFTELLQLILRDLGLDPQGDRVTLIEEINRYLIEQFRQRNIVCLLIDEAQNLSDETLEGLRLLSNLETDREKLLQIVLIGQPELESKLDQPSLRQLNQRVALCCRIAPLKDTEVGAYMDLRLREAGYQGEPLFNPDVVRKIALYSGGIPRVINSICDNALLITYANGHKRVAPDVIHEVSADLKLRAKTDIVDIDVPVVETPAPDPGNEFYGKVRTDRLRGSVRVGARCLAAVLLLAAVTAVWVLSVRNLFGSLFENPKNKSGLERLLRPAETLEEPKVTSKVLSPGEESRPIPINLKTPGLQGLKPRPTRVTSESSSARQREPEESERAPSLEHYDVVRRSFVRNVPRSDAQIIATLQPRTRVRIVGKTGSYFKIHSMDNEALRGYVHQEDAFFAVSKTSP